MPFNFAADSFHTMSQWVKTEKLTATHVIDLKQLRRHEHNPVICKRICQPTHSHNPVSTSGFSKQMVSSVSNH